MGQSLKPVLKKGELITCPSCEHGIGVVTRDCYWGEYIEGTMFYALEPQSTEYGVISWCCHMDWLKHGQVHTSEGWKP